MDRLFVSIADFSDPRVGGGDSFCDRLNNRYTVYVLVLFSALITTKLYVGEPISCFCPAHFESSHVDFANAVCWVQNTYYLPYDERIPKEKEHHAYIGYYQWVSLLLCCQSILFYLPRVIWRMLNKKSGIAVTTITDAAIECQRKSDSEDRDRTLKYMVKHMGRFLNELNRKILVSNKLKQFWLVVYGNYLLIAYMCVKFIYIGNVVGQLFLLNRFLGTKYHLYGFEIIQRLVDGEDLSNSERFPRVTMCDFYVRVVGNVQRYTVQCALPVNLFNEIIFIFVWFWFVFVAFATGASALIWFISSLSIAHQTKFIKARLIAMDKLGHAPDHMVRSFVGSYLRRDGIFIIRLVAKNSSDLIAAELIAGLFEHYKETKKTVEKLTSREEAALEADMEESPGGLRAGIRRLSTSFMGSPVKPSAPLSFEEDGAHP